MGIHTYSQVTAQGTTYYTTTIAPTITSTGEIVVTYIANVQSGTPIIPGGSRPVIGAMTTKGEKLTRI